MSNRLSQENSPYLLQHADNPVDWYPWSEEALERARQEDKPIFLSIGYAACHWCHVMAHESFEDPQIAAIMNENFINIKVDREERPDLDGIYMNAVVAMTGQGGWPMSVFLDADGLPFFGGTYYPPVRRYGMPSFRDVLVGIAQAWSENREQVLHSGQEIARHLRESTQSTGGDAEIQPQTLDEAAFRLAQTYGWEHGGWGSAPKFPQPMVIEYLLLRARRGDRMALDIAEHVLAAMAKGGMYDVVGGGFARYSTDNEWLTPHFEKMLYDNAQLARTYLHAYLLTGDNRYRRVCEETLDFISRELMARPQGETESRGGFYSSLDADSEGEEGKFYLWTVQEIRAALPDSQDADFILAAYGVTETGNFEGANILQRKLDDQQLAQRFNILEERVPERLTTLHQRLLQAREKRVRPGTDDKVLVSWNALALVAYAEAARYLDRNDYLETARLNADFLLTELYPKDRLLRSWRDGQARHNAYLEDHAALILGLLALYQSDPDPYWFSSSIQLADDMMGYFRDPNGGFFDTRDDHGPLLFRPKDLQDNATPSGNSLAAQAFLQLDHYTGHREWHEVAVAMITSLQDSMKRYPTAFGNWLCALQLVTSPIVEVAILGNLDDPLTQELCATLWSTFRPYTLAAISPYPPAPNDAPLLQDRPLVEGRPTVYVCQNFVCQRPVNTEEELLQLLEA